MRYRRSRVPGGTWLFTVVAWNRRSFFDNPARAELLRYAFRRVRRKHPVAVDAIVVLPDHLHCILTLPQGDTDYSPAGGS